MPRERRHVRPWWDRDRAGPEVLSQRTTATPNSSRLLIPYNGTAVARSALDTAIDLGPVGCVTAWVLYVRHWDASGTGQRFCLESSDEAQRCVRAAVAELRRRGLPTSGVVRDAPREKVGHAIAAEAERRCVSCIVMGTHAHGPLVAALLGSVTRSRARDHAPAGPGRDRRASPIGGTPSVDPPYPRRTASPDSPRDVPAPGSRGDGVGQTHGWADCCRRPGAVAVTVVRRGPRAVAVTVVLSRSWSPGSAPCRRRRHWA